MKILKNRQEIGEAMNFGKYAVVGIDLSKKDEYGIIGAKVRIDDGTKCFIRATLKAYSDDHKLMFSSCGFGLSSHKSYSDYMEDLEYANAPVIKPGSDIVIFTYNSQEKIINYPVIARVGEKVNNFCTTPITIEDIFIEF